MDGANPSLRAVSPLDGGFVVYGSWVKSSNGGVRQIGRTADLGAGCAGGRSLSAMDGANPSLRAGHILQGAYRTHGLHFIPETWVTLLSRKD